MKVKIFARAKYEEDKKEDNEAGSQILSGE